MTTQVRSHRHEEALTLAEKGNYQDAYELMDLHLQNAPNDSEALNDAAVLLHCLNRSHDAVDLLKRAYAIDTNNPEVVWNLVEAYLAEANADEVKPLLKYMEANEIIRIDILNRAADIFLNEGKLNDALEMLEWSLRMQPDQEILEPMCDIIRHKINEQATQTEK